MSVSDKLITEEIGQAISLLEGVLNRLHRLSKPTPVAEPTPQIAPSTIVELEDVRAALTKLASAKGATYVKALLADHHAKKLSDLAPASYAVVLLAAEKELGSE